MPVYVSYVQAGLVSPGGSAIVGANTRAEQLTDGTAGAAATGTSLALVVNTESTARRIAWGSTPDTSATSSTAATSAFLIVPAGGMAAGPIAVKEGDKFLSNAL